MKAIIYCRVSTTEQAQEGFSLRHQEIECRKFAQENGYEVDKVFIEEGESAKTQDRTQLQKLIQYSVENSKELDALIIWKYDRLTRNLSDQMALAKNFSSLGIRVLSVTENNEETPVGNLMRNIIGSFAQFDNEVKAERCSAGMKQAIKEGRWVWNAPLGYKNDKEKSLIKTDLAIYIKEAFELYSSGIYKQQEVVKKLKEQGWKQINKNALGKILTNPIYTGYIKCSWFPDPIKGIHEPIIDQATFDLVQLLITGRRKTITSYKRNNPDFPLRGLITCPICNHKLTASWSKGRSGKKFGYYHCVSKDCSFKAVPKSKLEEKFINYLQSIKPSSSIMELFKVIVLDVYKQEQGERIKEGYRLEKELQTLKEKQDKLLELLISDSISKEDYRIKGEMTKNEIIVKQLELNEHTIDENDIETCINFATYWIENIDKLWEQADLNLKQQFQNIIFPENLYYDQLRFRTASLSPIFAIFKKISEPEYSLVHPRRFELRTH